MTNYRVKTRLENLILVIFMKLQVKELNRTLNLIKTERLL